MNSPKNRTKNTISLFLRLASLSLIAAAPFHTAMGQTAPSLGTASSFGILGASTVTNTGPTIITGDLGVSPGSAITGFPPGLVVGGATHAADAVALQAQTDTTTAYNALAGQPCNTTFGVPTDIGGMTLVPGVYCFASSAQITGALTLNAGGDPNAVWIFKVGSTLVTASSATVLLINGAQNCNVFWQVGSSATLGTSTSFIGNILALTSISLTTNATISGRALARNGAVTMDTNLITPSSCAIVPVRPVPPTISKAFSPAIINAGGTSTLTLTLVNPNNSVATLSAPFTDTLPANVSTSGAGANTCGGVVTSNASSVTLTGGSIPANGSCTVTVNVTGSTGGNFINSLPTGSLQTSNGSNTAPAAATLTVIPATPTAPIVNKAFAPASVTAGDPSTLTITLINPNNSIATLSAPFTDTLPANVFTSGSGANTCGGTLSVGVSSVTLTGGSIPANGSCTVTVNTTAFVAGNYIDTIAAGSLQTSNGNNAAPASATLTVIPVVTVAPIVSKTFAPVTIPAGGTSTLTLTLVNPNNTVATLTAPFTDTLPANVFTSGGGSNTCGGTVSVGASSVTLTGGSIPANGSCTVSVNVTGSTGGNFINSLAIGALQTSNGNNAVPAVATLTVIPATPGAPLVSKAFAPASIPAGGISTLTITLVNPNNSIATLSAPLTDTLPIGVFTAGGGSNTCGGTVTLGASSVTLTGGSIPTNGSCTVTVNVTGSIGGNFINTLAIGALQTSNGNNTTPAIATLTVIPAVNTGITVSKGFSPSTITVWDTSTLTITLHNANNSVAHVTGSFTDYLPGGLIPSGTCANTCGGTATFGASTVTLTGGSMPANGSCQVTVKVKPLCEGTFSNKIPIATLHTDLGCNVNEGDAILTVIHPVHNSSSMIQD